MIVSPDRDVEIDFQRCCKHLCNLSVVPADRTRRSYRKVPTYPEFLIDHVLGMPDKSMVIALFFLETYIMFY